MNIHIHYAVLKSIKTMTDIMQIIERDSFTVIDFVETLKIENFDFGSAPESMWVELISPLILAHCDTTEKEYSNVFMHARKIDFITDEKTISYNNTTYPGKINPKAGTFILLSETHGVRTIRAKGLVEAIVGEYFTVECDASGRNIQIKTKTNTGALS